MSKNLNVLVLILLIGSTSYVKAQSSIEKEWPIMKNSPNFYNIQDAWYANYDSLMLEYEVFNVSFPEQDDLMDKFKRWEYLMQTRVDKNGNFPDPAIAFKETEKYKLEHPSYFSSTRAATWEPVGSATVPSNGGGAGRVNCIMIDPIDYNILYLGAAGGGVWKSPDAGSTWIPLGDQLPVTSIADIAIDPANTDILYVATGDGAAYEITWQIDQDFWGGVYSAGVLKSTNGGLTWDPTGLSYNQDNLEIIQRLVIHPTSSNILVAATRNGMFRTTDGGDSWDLVSTEHCYDIAINTANPDIMYAVNSTDVLISTNAGSTWSVLESGLGSYGRSSIETTEANAEAIFVLNEGGGFYRSQDGGDTWDTQKDPKSKTSFYGYYDMQFDASNVNEDHIMSGGLEVVRNTTGGDNNWAKVSQWSDSGDDDYVHADSHCFAYHPTDENKIYAGNDGGIFISNDNGTTWTDLSDGLRIAQIYRISTAQTAPEIVIGGWQDNGTNLWNGTSWEEVDYSTYDGMEALIDHSDEDIMFLAHQYGDVYKSDDGGSSWESSICCGNWVTPYVMDPNTHTIMYYGAYGDLSKSTNTGNSWSNIGGGLGDYITAISVSPANSEYVYASSLTAIKITTNSGDTWSSITGSLPLDDIGINYIATSDVDENKVWIALSGYSSGEKVFYSFDAGDTWTNVSGTLPNVPINTVVFENGSDDRIYVGTDIGVYTKDNTSDWEPYMDGLPNVMIHELEINYNSMKLVAATYGRGVWESDLYSAVLAPSISTMVVVDTYCPGATLVVNYLAVGTYTGGNTFTAQLSNETGSFASPENIGTYISSDLSGSISCVIPDDVSGSFYRIRVVSSSPAIIGTDNGFDISINCPAPENLIVSGITETDATFSWDPVECSDSYLVTIMVDGWIDPETINTSFTTATFSSFDANSLVTWSVQTLCTGSLEIGTSISAVGIDFNTLQTGITNQSLLESSFSIYPNPVDASASIDFNLLEGGIYQIDIVDVAGKTILTLLNGQLNPGKNSFNLDARMLQNGTYFIEISKNNNALFLKSFIVE